MKNITIKGARLHNLKEIDISIPKNKLIVASGVSGSGKSTLVFDIIFEEGRRQYLHLLGVFAGIDDKDKFDEIAGIGPTIAVQQNIIRQSNPRSTLGTRTNILNMLAVLYAGEGEIACSECGIIVENNLICEKCGYTEERFPAGYFSYNNPNGMCFKCSGRGAYFQIHMEKLVSDELITLEQIFDKIMVTPGLKRVLYRHFGDYLKMPFSKIPDEVKEKIIYGQFASNNAAKRSMCLTRIFDGFIHKYGEDPTGVYKMSKCSECHGFRIGDEARRVFLNKKHIGKLGTMTLDELYVFLEKLLKSKKLTAFGINLIKEIQNKINNLIKSRLGYLSLYREVSSLSGGEIQRLFLNSHIDSKMDSLIYILDEPTSGLHESEKDELLKSLNALK